MKWEIGLSEQRQRGARLSFSSTEAAAATLNNNKSIFPPLNTAADDDDIIDNFSHSFQPFIQCGVWKIEETRWYERLQWDIISWAGTTLTIEGKCIDKFPLWNFLRSSHYNQQGSRKFEFSWIFPLYVLFVIVECWMENRLIIQRLSFPLIEFVESVLQNLQCYFWDGQLCPS